MPSRHRPLSRRLAHVLSLALLLLVAQPAAGAGVASLGQAAQVAAATSAGPVVAAAAVPQSPWPERPAPVALPAEEPDDVPSVVEPRDVAGADAGPDRRTGTSRERAPPVGSST